MIKFEIKKKIEQEKESLAREFNKINIDLAKAKKKLEISKAQEKASAIEAKKKLKIEKTKYLIDLKKLKDAELEWRKNIKSKKANLSLMNKASAEKTRVCYKRT